MKFVFDAFLLLLVVNLAAGLLRALRGPRVVDRLIAAQLFGTIGVGILLVLAATQHLSALRDVALVFVLLGPLAVAAYARATSMRSRRVPSSRDTP